MIYQTRQIDNACPSILRSITIPEALNRGYTASGMETLPAPADTLLQDLFDLADANLTSTHALEVRNDIVEAFNIGCNKFDDI